MAAFKRLDIDRDSRINFNEFGKLFAVATEGISNSTKNLKIEIKKKIYNSSNNSLSPCSKSTAQKINNLLLKKSPSKSNLINIIKKNNKINRENNILEGNRSQSIFNRSIERFNMSTAKYSEITKSFDKFKNEENNSRGENKYLKSNFRNTSSSIIEKNKIIKNDALMSFYSNRDAKLDEYYENNRASLEEEKLRIFFEELIECENEIENAKNNLIINEDFNAEDAFKLFELNGKGFLTTLDLKCGMHSLEIYPSNEEISLLVRRYDLTREGILS